MKAYEGVASRHVIPALGHLPLARVTPRDVQGLYNSMQDAGRSAATMKPTRAVLVMVFKQAILWRYLRANPAEGVRLPASKKPPRVGYAFTQAEALRFVYVKVLPEMRQRLSGSLERLLSESTGNQLAHSEAAGVM